MKVMLLLLLYMVVVFRTSIICNRIGIFSEYFHNLTVEIIAVL